LTSLPRSFPAQRLSISLTSRSLLERKPVRPQRSRPESLPLAYSRHAGRPTELGGASISFGALAETLGSCTRHC
jgi:hypothetical protein